MTNAGKRLSDFEAARSKVTYAKGHKPYQVCTVKTCRGWEYVANNKDECRVCGSPLSRPSPRQRPRTPRARRRQPSADAQSKDSTTASSVGDELLAILQSQMPALEDKCPELAKQVKDALPAAPVPAAAAELHDAQASCQIAFKAMQAADNTASQCEQEAADISKELREKIVELQEAQETAYAARVKYDESAKRAQIQVLRNRTGVQSDEKTHIAELVHNLRPDQLDEVANALIKAAQAARVTNNVTPSPSPTPSQQEGAATCPSGGSGSVCLGWDWCCSSCSSDIPIHRSLP